MSYSNSQEETLPALHTEFAELASSEISVTPNQVDDSVLTAFKNLISKKPLIEAGVQPDDSSAEPDGCIEPSRPVSEIRPDPYPLPAELEIEWSSIDLRDDRELDELQTFLSENYVEDVDDGGFRFRYSADFLRWALCPPGYHGDWHIPIRAKATRQIVAFISSIPIAVRVRENVLTAREVNFLCVHKTMRGNRLTPLLLSEATRRGHLRGVNYALWTSGNLFPNPISACLYHHRPLNVPKLVDVGFLPVSPDTTVESLTEKYRLPDKELPLVGGLREMEERDVHEVSALYNAYMHRFDLALELTREEVQHHLLGCLNSGLLPRERFVWTYVVELISTVGQDPGSGALTDFISFFSTPYSILSPNAGQYQVLKIAYLYFYATSVATTSTEADANLKHRLTLLVENALYLAKQHKFDVFNALTLMDNLEFLRSLEFASGSGLLRYYLDNWRTAPLAGVDPVGDIPAGRGVGVVML